MRRDEERSRAAAGRVKWRRSTWLWWVAAAAGWWWVHTGSNSGAAARRLCLPFATQPAERADSPGQGKKKKEKRRRTQRPADLPMRRMSGSAWPPSRQLPRCDPCCPSPTLSVLGKIECSYAHPRRAEKTLAGSRRQHLTSTDDYGGCGGYDRNRMVIILRVHRHRPRARSRKVIGVHQQGCVCEGGSTQPCARGVHQLLFAALARVGARLAAAKNNTAARLLRNADFLRFF
jgi:hypothetical protein